MACFHPSFKLYISPLYLPLHLLLVNWVPSASTLFFKRFNVSPSFSANRAVIQQLWAIKLVDINCLEYTEVHDLKNHCTSVSYYYYLTILEEIIND